MFHTITLHPLIIMSDGSITSEALVLAVGQFLTRHSCLIPNLLSHSNGFSLQGHKLCKLIFLTHFSHGFVFILSI